MTTVNLSDDALLAFFQSHPHFRDRLASIVGAVGNLDGDLGLADAAEERLVEEMRLLGREALQGWANERVEATERDVRGQTGMHRQGKKNSAGTRNSAIPRSYTNPGNLRLIGPAPHARHGRPPYRPSIAARMP